MWVSKRKHFHFELMRELTFKEHKRMKIVKKGGEMSYTYGRSLSLPDSWHIILKEKKKKKSIRYCNRCTTCSEMYDFGK